MALITCYDADGVAHQKEPVDARESCLHNGFTMAIPGGTEDGAVTEYVPTKQELLAARADLLTRKDQLDQFEIQLNLRSDALNEREQALAERERQSIASMSKGSTEPDIASITKAQLQAALDSKEIKFPAGADKAELQALLTSVPTE